MNEEQLKKKVKTNQIIIGVLVILLIIAIIILITTRVSANSKENNNISNLGMVCSGDGYVFYYKYGVGIIKIKDGKEYQISEDRAYSMSYYDGYVYYTRPNSNGGIDIAKTSHNGDTVTVLKSVTTSSTKMYLNDGNLYYLTSNPNTISKMDLNGENEKVIITREVLDFHIKDDIIYFVTSSKKLCKISTSGNNYEQLSDETLAPRFQMNKDFIYYYKENEGLYKISLKTFEVEEVSKKVNCDVFNVTGKNIYFLDKDNLKVCSMNLKGEKIKEIVTVNTKNTKINIVDNVLYYLGTDDGSSNYKTYRVKTDGKEMSEVEY